MLHFVVPAALQNVYEAHQVAVYVRVRILDGIAHPRLGRQVDHPSWSLALEHRGESVAVRDVDLLEPKCRTHG